MRTAVPLYDRKNHAECRFVQMGIPKAKRVKKRKTNNAESKHYTFEFCSAAVVGNLCHEWEYVCVWMSQKERHEVATIIRPRERMAVLRGKGSTTQTDVLHNGCCCVMRKPDYDWDSMVGGSELTWSVGVMGYGRYWSCGIASAGRSAS